MKRNGGGLLFAVGCWPSAIGYLLSASCWARHSDPRRRISVNGGFEINGSKYQLAGRHQTYSIPECKKGAPLRGRLYKRVVFASLKGAMGEKLYSRKQEGSGALRRPGSSRRRACGPWASPVPPAGRAGSERELYMPPVGGSRGAAIKLIALPEGRYHHPLNPLNPLNLLNPHFQRACPTPCTEILRLRLRMTRPAGSPLNEGNTTFLHNLPRQRRPLTAEPPSSGSVK